MAHRTGSEGDLLVRKSRSRPSRASADDEGPVPTHRIPRGDVEEYRDDKASGGASLEVVAGEASPLGAVKVATTPAQRRRGGGGGGGGGGSVRRKPSAPSRSERKPSRCEFLFFKRCEK